MNRTEFLNEVRESHFYSSDFETLYRDFVSHQDELLRCLKEVHRVFEKHSINYQLAYGTLLGAIRDKRQLPWDYDIDLFVAYKDRQKIIEALQKDLSDLYYFDCIEKNGQFSSFFFKIGLKNKSTMFIHIDTFCLIGLPDDVQEQKVFLNKIETLSKARVFKLLPFQFKKSNWKGILYKIFWKMRYITHNLDNDAILFNNLCSSYNIDEVSYISTADVYTKWYKFPSELFLDTILIDTMDGSYRVPRNFDKMLTIIYGNYLNLPSLESRIDEINRFYKNIEE